MVYSFKFPDVGEGITEGQIVRWRVKVGDKIKQDQILVDVETDKSIAEVPSPKAGIILELRGKEGGKIAVGDVIAVIGENGESVSRQEKSSQLLTTLPRPPQKGVGVVGELEEAGESNVFSRLRQRSNQQTAQPRPRAMLRVKELAREKGVDVRTLRGAGVDGAVCSTDLAAQQPDVTVKVSDSATGLNVQRKYDMFGHVKRLPLVGIRKTIAVNMVRSVTTVAAVTTTDEIDVTRLWGVREKEKVLAQKKGVKLTFLAYIMKALAAALKEHPYLNSSLEEEEIVLKEYYNLGFAVDADGKGLLVPVVKGVDQKDILHIATELEKLAHLARTMKLDKMDMKGGTFTITNYGSLGGLFATPIINYPEAAILGLGKIYDKAVPLRGKVKIRKTLPVSLTFDHRILDGAAAQQFINTLKRYLEDPDLLLVA